MAFLVTRKWSGNSSSSESKDGRTGSSNDVLKFDVVASDPSFASPYLAKYAPGVPVIRSAHPDDTFSRCVRVGVEQTSPIRFVVTAYYEKASSGANENPLNDPPNVELFSVTSQEDIDEDFDGNPTVTANGEPLLGIKRPITDLGIRVEKNLPLHAAPSIHQYFDTTNSVPFLGFPSGMVRMMELSERNSVFDNFEFAVLTARFQVRKQYRETAPSRVWWKRVRHQGFYIKVEDFPVPGLNAIVHAVDDNGELVTRPVQLKLDGTPETDKTKAHWLEIKVLGSADYNTLNLGV